MHIFHQNMWVFGGRTAVRNAAYTVQLTAIGIAWNPDELNITCAGQVAKTDVRTWTAYRLDAPFADQTAIAVPGTALLDTRGLAFIAGMRGAGGGRKRRRGTGAIIGFMHNMYNLGNRSGDFERVPTMVERIKDRLGGDFNIRPRSPGDLTAYGEKADAVYVNTTLHHPYDFWLTKPTDLSSDANCVVNHETQVANRSDHADITLKF